MKDQTKANFSLNESVITSWPDINRLLTESYPEDTANGTCKNQKGSSSWTYYEVIWEQLKENRNKDAESVHWFLTAPAQAVMRGLQS